jgi:hypothetical protein
MGCENSRTKYIKLVKELSKNALDDRQLEDIMMNTYCKVEII